jgi:phosphate acetyltransferase
LSTQPQSTRWSATRPTFTFSINSFTVTKVWPPSDVALLGAVEGASDGLIAPILVGPSAEIKALAAKLGVDISGFRIQEADTEEKAASADVCRREPHYHQAL